MAYEFDYVKRIIIASIAVVICGTNVFDDFVVVSMNSVFLYTSLIFIVLALIDYYITGKVFGNADLVFRNFWKEIATYYPAATK